MSKNNHIRRISRPAQARGVTLIELMVTIGILTLLIGMAMPMFTNVIKNSRIRSQSSDLLTNLAIARAESAKRAVRVTLCASTTWANATPSCTGGGATAWSNGYIVFADQNGNGSFDAGSDTVIAVSEPLSGGNVLQTIAGFGAPASADKFQFRPSGATNLPAAGGTFKLCDDRSGSAGKQVGRQIVLTVTGRAASSFTDCP